MLYLIFLLVLLVAVGGGGWFAWQQFGGGGALFGGSRDSRIGVTEIAAVDSKRKLVLIRRDGVEHLIMTGGPIDVVIEQGILPQKRLATSQVPQQHLSPAPAFEPRFASQAVPAVVETVPDPSAGFGRLRQRTAQPPPEPHPRAELTGMASGGTGR